MKEIACNPWRGVGGMRKAVVKAEIEHLKPFVELGGYIPFPDHHISPDAKWDNVRYYCDRMHEIFSCNLYLFLEEFARWKILKGKLPW